MNLAEYRQHVEAVPYGKRLPSALYVFRAADASLGEELDSLLARVAAACGADARHNVLKLRVDELKVSFLAYPEFMTDPHPELHHAITVDLATGKSRQTDYTASKGELSAPGPRTTGPVCGTYGGRGRGRALRTDNDDWLQVELGTIAERERCDHPSAQAATGRR